MGNHIKYRRLLLSCAYVAAAVIILGAVLCYALSRRNSAAEPVSASQVTPTEISVSDADAADADDSAARAKEPEDGDFVRVREYLPDVEVELMYATDRNFTGKVIYAFDDAWLRYGTVRKLAEAQEAFRTKGVRLKIWDAFRPVSAQFRLWEICPNPRYVANPEKGYSSHSRGNTVDVTLVDSEGKELAMPTGFDDFSRRADRNYADIKDKTAFANAQWLEKVMKECGFKPYSGEWWHFSDTVRYDVAEDFVPEE